MDLPTKRSEITEMTKVIRYIKEWPLGIISDWYDDGGQYPIEGYLLNDRDILWLRESINKSGGTALIVKDSNE